MKKGRSSHEEFYEGHFLRDPLLKINKNSLTKDFGTTCWSLVGVATELDFLRFSIGASPNRINKAWFNKECLEHIRKLSRAAFFT